MKPDATPPRMTDLKPDANGFRYVLMWLDYLIKRQFDADQSYLIEWRKFIADCQALVSETATTPMLCSKHGGYGFTSDCRTCNAAPQATGESIADLIPKWYESGTIEGMLAEAFAQIRMLEATRSATRETQCEKTGRPCEATHLCHFPVCQYPPNDKKYRFPLFRERDAEDGYYVRDSDWKDVELADLVAMANGQATASATPMPQWVQVSERLPKAEYGDTSHDGVKAIISADVLCAFEDGIVRVGNYDHEEGYWHMVSINEPIRSDIDPTHWMPMPKPPEYVGG